MAEKPVNVLVILAAMAGGAALGALAGTEGTLLGVDVIHACDFVGSLFINLLKMLIVPLVMASVITGVSGMGSGRSLGRLGLTSFAFYVITTLMAVLIALCVLNVVQPGLVHGEPARDLLALHADAASVDINVRAKAQGGLLDLLLGMVPTNIVEAASGTKLLGLLFFSVLFGFFLTRIESPYRESVSDFWQGIYRVMMRMTDFVMHLAPIGVFGLTARVVARTGFASAGPILLFGLCVVLSLAIFALIALPLLIRVVGRVRPWGLFSALAPALLTAFSTASSSATLPLTMECTEKRAGVSARISGFVLPLGVSVNHAGSALYECAAALFIAQAYGLHLSFATQFTIVVLALVTSMGIAGIPAASLVGITVILGAVGLPAEAIGVLLVLDRLLDMARTAVNVLADAACAVIVARLAGERDVLSGRVPDQSPDAS
jgi:Na+/H+-dicarboxylate symporter